MFSKNLRQFTIATGFFVAIIGIHLNGLSQKVEIVNAQTMTSNHAKEIAKNSIKNKTIKSI